MIFSTLVCLLITAVAGADLTARVNAVRYVADGYLRDRHPSPDSHPELSTDLAVQVTDAVAEAAELHGQDG